MNVVPMPDRAKEWDVAAVNRWADQFPDMDVHELSRFVRILHGILEQVVEALHDMGVDL